MEDVHAKPIDDTIWITSRVRMISERKALRNQNISFLAVTYYSLFTVILAVFSDVYGVIYPLYDEITLSSSIIVLVSSLVASGFRLEARATAFRECYLKLQYLHDAAMPQQDKKIKYRKLLDNFPNHSPSDYTDFIIDQLVVKGETLSNGGHEVGYTVLMICSFAVRRALVWGLVVALFSGPIIFLTFPFFF